MSKINKKKVISQGTTKVSLCGVDAKGIEIAGRVFVPDAATAYVEFYMAHCFPVFLDNAAPKEKPDRTTLHPAVMARSYQSLVGKPMNMCHLMKAYDPKKILRDRILGTVMAVEFATMPDGGWQVQGNPDLAPGLRGVAALHKNAEGVAAVIESWENGETPFGKDTTWTVSMENESYLEEGGFLLKAGTDLGPRISDFQATTPEDFRALGWVYVPYMEAPEDLKECLKDGGYIGIEKMYQGRDTLFLNGGLTGQIFFYGVALTPEGKETAARVGRIMAAKDQVVDISAAFEPIMDFLKKVTDCVRATD